MRLNERSKCSRRSNVQMFKTQKFIVSQKPNFYTELGCEVSGDAAREGANRALESKHAAKVRQR